MKIRTDFITNSSSSAFVILTKEHLTNTQIKDELIKVLKVPMENFIFPHFGEDIAKVLVSCIDGELDIHEYIDAYSSAERIEDLQRAGIMGKAIYENYREYPFIKTGATTNESDEALEVLLTETDIYFKNDKFVIIKDGGY